MKQNQTTLENRSGYKWTKVGWIPEDWEIINLNSCSNIDEENLSSKTDQNYSFRYISLSDIENRKVKQDLKIIEFKNAPSRARKIVRKGDILLATVRPNLKSFAKIEDDAKDLVASTGFAIIRTKNIVDSSFLFQFLFGSKMEAQLYNLVVGSNYPAINSSDVRNLKIVKPPLAEQKKIGDIFSIWDTAIEKLNQLITHKELRKKGLMQQLLTGKKRLPGFSGEWEELKIQEIAKELSLKNTEDKEIIVLSCTKYDGLVPSLEYFGRKIYSDDTSSYKIVPKYHFAYATNHIEEGSIGYQSEFENGLVSPMYTVFKTHKNIDDGFLYRLLKSYRLIHEYNRHMEGSINRRGGLRWKSFSKIKINLPAFEEQQAIFEVLQIAEKDIRFLNKKLEKLKTQKKGLMQQLLTGKKRLIN